MRSAFWILPCFIVIPLTSSLECEDHESFWKNPKHAFTPSPDQILSQSPLGKGSFGKVYTCTYNRSRSVLKLIEFDPDSRDTHHTPKEVAIQEKLKNSFTAVRIEACVRGSDYIGLVMPLKGPSFSKLKETISRMSFLEQVRVFLKIAQAVSDIGAQGVIHNDLKPGNIVAGLRDTDYVTGVWVIDFGLACAPMRTCKGGTLAYSPPEKLKAGLKLKGDYSLDAWAAFVIIVSLHGNLPTRDIERMIDTSCWEYMSSKCHSALMLNFTNVLADTPTWFQELILSGLAYVPEKRIGIVQLGETLRHHYIQMGGMSLSGLKQDSNNHSMNHRVGRRSRF